ncbi:unnamed protein product [Cuscuta campestris]|uniref:RNase H type-1 domain-containing protein n=1 Tax=Cuscuta campestris TaxID=132261 RepID=A0A484MW51_9ASTE|nr:unnamed protein product [Cuscuta campestris]
MDSQPIEDKEEINFAIKANDVDLLRRLLPPPTYTESPPYTLLPLSRRDESRILDLDRAKVPTGWHQKRVKRAKLYDSRIGKSRKKWNLEELTLHSEEARKKFLTWGNTKMLQPPMVLDPVYLDELGHWQDIDEFLYNPKWRILLFLQAPASLEVTIEFLCSLRFHNDGEEVKSTAEVTSTTKVTFTLMGRLLSLTVADLGWLIGLYTLDETRSLAFANLPDQLDPEFDHKGKKTRRSRRRPGKGPLIEEVLVEDVPEGEDDESSECRISAFKRLGGEDTRVSAFDWLNRGPEGRLGDLRRQISEGRRRNAEESATSDARSVRPERTEGRTDERTQRRQSPSRTEKTKVPERGMTELAREIAELKRRVETKSPYSQPILRTVTPFTPRVMSVPLPTNFRPWQIKAYSGTTDPQDHLSKFYASMEAAAATDEVKCRCFLATLEGSACDWFNRLQKGTIDDWDTLAEKFLTHFAANRRQRLPYSHLLNICIRKGEKVRDFIVRWEKEARDVHGADDQALVAMQRLPYSHLLNICIRKGEKVRDFIVRWEKEARDVHGADDQALVAMFQAALPRGEVRKELRKNPPPTYQDTLARAKFLASEEFDDALESEAAPAKRASVDSGEAAKKRKKKKDSTAGPRTPSAGVYSVGAPVGAGRELALSPLPHVEAYAVSSGTKYCEYHRNNTHNTKECFTLQKEMQRLIARGPLLRDDAATPSRGPPEGRTWRKATEPIAVATQARNPEKRHIGRECDDLDEDEAQGYPVGFIHGGNIGGDSAAQRKRWKHMAFVAKDLRPVRTPLSGFTGDSIEAEGVIAVSVIVGDGAHKAKLKMEFMVVSINCAHNMILGRPGLEDLECVISPYYLCMKFPTPSGIGVARGDQKLAQSCYVRITKKLPRDETMVVHAQEGMRKLEARPSAEPAEEVEEVPLDPQVPERKVKVGATLTTSQRMRLVEVLAAYRVTSHGDLGICRGWTPRSYVTGWRSTRNLGRYSVAEKTVLAVVSTVQRLTPYFQAHPVQVLSQQPIGALLRSPNAPSRMSKWAVFLGAFQIEFKPRPAIKGQALADFVVECTAREEPSPELEADGWWTVFTDGSSAAKNSGGGVVVIAPEGFRAYYSIRFSFKASNNEAEYEALLCGLRLAAGMNATKLRIKCDSKLVVGHVSGEFEAKDERMKKYRDTALELLKSFTAYSVEQILRAENAEADILSKLSSDTPEHIRRMANVEELSEPSIHAFPVAMICAQPRDWTDDIVAFLKDGTLPDESMKAKLVQTRAPGYTLEGEKLYKRAYNGTLLRFLRPAEAKQVMEEVHAGICSAHQGARRAEHRPCPDALPGQRPNLRIRHYSSIEEPSADHVRMLFPDKVEEPSAEHVRMLFPDEGLTFVLGTPPQEKSRAQGRAERRPCPDDLPGRRSNLRARHSPSGEEPSADRVRMLFPDEGLTFVLGTPPQGKSRVQSLRLMAKSEKDLIKSKFYSSRKTGKYMAQTPYNN